MTSNWKECKIENLNIQIIDGDRGKNYPNKQELLDNGDCLFLSAQNVTKNGFNFNETQWITKERDNLLRNGKLVYGDIVITTRGTVGNVALYSKDIKYESIRINSGMLIVRCGEGIFNEYIYYVLSSQMFAKKIASMQTGTAQPQLPKSHFQKMEILLPPFETQKKIAKVLSAIDDKIELNNSINNNLEQQAMALFNNYFQYKINDTLPENWRVGTFGEIIELHDSKRVPLSGQDRDQMQNKIYPYYGAASLMDYVDNYIFDGIYLLLGEDGTVVDNYGMPILQYVWGKFWVNNHAHILTGKNGFNVESLYLLFKQTSIKSIVTGAVQAKISQANLKALSVVIPPESLLVEFNCKIKNLFALLRNNKDENEKLVQLRDALLPKLMSGEIDVSNVEIEDILDNNSTDNLSFSED